MNNSRRGCFFVILLLVLSNVDLLAQTNRTWNRKNAEAWYKKHEWLNDRKASEPTVKYDQFGRIIETGLSDSNATKVTSLHQQQLKPHESIDKVEFAKQYHAHKLWWDKAFAYLKNTDLDRLTPGDHPIVGDDVFARVTEGPLKNIDSARWEAHKNFADIHYVIKGREKIGIGELSKAKLVVPYNSTRDLSFYDGKGKYYVLEPGTYILAFTHQIHRPGLEVDGKETEKKVVIKVRTPKSN
jgi:YhcH/YjgK/YiaL family protein